MEMAVTGSAIPVLRHSQAEAGPVMGADLIRARAARHAVMVPLSTRLPVLRKDRNRHGQKTQNRPAVSRDQDTPRLRACHLQRTGATLAPPRPWRGSFFGFCGKFRWQAGALTRLR